MNMVVVLYVGIAVLVVLIGIGVFVRLGGGRRAADGMGTAPDTREPGDVRAATQDRPSGPGGDVGMGAETGEAHPPEQETFGDSDRRP